MGRLVFNDRLNKEPQCLDGEIMEFVQIYMEPSIFKAPECTWGRDVSFHARVSICACMDMRESFSTRACGFRGIVRAHARGRASLGPICISRWGRRCCLPPEAAH